MKMILPFLCFLIAVNTSMAQSTYLDKILIKTSDETHITASNDGSWLVSYSIKNDPDGFHTDGIQLIKYNVCQEIEWTKEYQLPGNKINVGAILQHSNGELFLTGTFRNNPNYEDLFLLKLDDDGQAIFFKVYSREFRELIYSFGETPGGHLMIFGISYSEANQSRNCFLTISTQGEVVSASSHAEAGIWGRGLACSDGGYIGRMSRQIFKVDANGNSVWANSYTGVFDVSAPVEVPGGYVFASSRVSNSFFDPHYLFKLDYEGDIVWVSAGYKANGYATLEKMPNGNILCMDSYYEEEEPDKFEASLIEFSPEGQQLSNQKILTTYGGTSRISRDIALLPDGSVLFSVLSGANRDTLYVAKSDPSFDFACGQINNVNEDTVKVIPYEPYSLPNNPITFDVADYALEVLDVTLSPETLCENIDINFPPTLPDTTICMGEEIWLHLNLPGATIEWQDGTMADSLLVNSSGSYEANITLCNETITIPIQTIFVEDCPCYAALPNAFTPNNDGRDDVFQLLQTCDVTDFKMDIYNRWGDLIFSSTNADEGWNGMDGGAPAVMDVYLFRCQYRLEEEGGGELLEEVGNLTLIR